MKSWADKFFENSWLRIARHNSTTGALEVNGSAITGVASGTWVEFVALTVDELLDLDQMVYHVTNVHCNAAGIGGCYFARDASPAGWGQISGPLFYTNVSDFPAAASWTDLRCHATATGLDYKSNGTIYEISGGKGVIANGATPVRVLSPAATFTVVTPTSAAAGADTLLTSAGVHGLTTAICVTAGVSYIYISAGTNWTVGFHKINAIAVDTTGVTIQIDTPWNAGFGTPTIALAGTEFILRSVVIPPLTTEGYVEVDAAWGSSSGSGTKTPSIRFGAAGSGITGTLYNSPSSPHGAGVLSMVPFKTVIQNAGSASSQTGLMSAAALAAGSVISSSAIPTSTINTSVATEVNITATMTSANDPIWLNRYVVSVGT